MLNFITFLQTISDSDYGYNFFSFKILKYWHAFLPVNDTIIITWPIWGLACFYQKVIVVKKKWGSRAVFNARAGPEKAMMAYSLTRCRTEKRQEGKTRKMGDRGIARIFLREWRGGHTVSNRGYSPFFCYLNILGCLFEKRLKKGILTPPPSPPWPLGDPKVNYLWTKLGGPCGTSTLPG